MKSKLTAIVVVMATSVAAGVFATNAQAGCADISAYRTAPSGGAPQRTPDVVPRFDGMMKTGYRPVAEIIRPASDGAAIVGLWKFVFVAAGNPQGPPDGTQLDVGYATWHADGTEITNSGKAPASSSFCMGVWKQTAHASFKLNHWALSWTDDGTTFIGPTNIREQVVVDKGGMTFSGSFTIDQYDPAGVNIVGHVQGTVTGGRITTDD